MPQNLDLHKLSGVHNAPAGAGGDLFGHHADKNATTMTRRDLYREFLLADHPPAMVEAIINKADYLCPGGLDVVVMNRAEELRSIKGANAESQRLSDSQIREDIGFFHRVRKAMDN